MPWRKVRPEEEGGDRRAGRNGPLPIAAPSWVMPGSMAANAQFLAGKVAEIGLCCFEAGASADMAEDELPQNLARLPLRWHVHLPADIFEDSGADAGRSALQTWARVAFLRPWIGVLHLPGTGGGAAWLRDFVQVWRDAGQSPQQLALENVRAAAHDDYAHIFDELGVSLCLDIGHAVAYGHTVSDAPWLHRVRLAHWSAPGRPPQGGDPVDRHLPLTELTPNELLFAGRAAVGLPRGVTHLVEVFHWEGVEQSWPVLRNILAQGRN